MKELDLILKRRVRISPAPLREIAPFLSDFANGKRTSYELKKDEDLLEGLRKDYYQLYTDYFCICKNSNTEMLSFVNDLANILSDRYPE